jgi:hypothetical protein
LRTVHAFIPTQQGILKKKKDLLSSFIHNSHSIISPTPLCGGSVAQPDKPPPLTLATLSAADETMQKSMLGKLLYPLPELTGKMTGMFLEMGNSEVLHLLLAHNNEQDVVHAFKKCRISRENSRIVER